jgi:transposase
VITSSIHNHRWCRLKLIWADGAYAHIVEEVRKQFGWTLDIVRRSDKAKGFEILPHRWIVERTFGWLGRYRRLYSFIQRIGRLYRQHSAYAQISHKLT